MQILKPLEVAVAWIMVSFHAGLTKIGMPAGSGWTWTFAIVGLVIVIRIVLIPLFVRQIRSSRGMQLIQPELKKIQQKYKGKTDQESRQAMMREQMALYKTSGTNPFSSCLPILLQAPVFFALFQVLRGIGHKSFSVWPFTESLRLQASNAKIFGSPLSESFMGTHATATKILTVVLIVLMSATVFTTQRQLMTKNMPASAMDNPLAQQQKILLYVMPLIFAFSGVNFPIGVLIYWLTTNLWTMGQQFYVIRRMPAPGSKAEERLLERRKAKEALEHRAWTEGGGAGDDEADEAPQATGGQRQQPKRQPRSKRGPQQRPGAGRQQHPRPRPQTAGEGGKRPEAG